MQLKKILKAMEERGLAPHKKTILIPDGRLHRYRVKGDKKHTKNGVYRIFHDDEAWFGSVLSARAYVVFSDRD